MATHGPSYGLSADIAKKQAAKYDHDLERQVRLWMGEILGEPFPDAGFQEAMKDGTLLCNLINKLEPGSVKKIKTSKVPFMQMENISQFLQAAERYGLKRTDLFQTVDLYEGKGMNAVLDCLLALASQAKTKGVVTQSNPGVKVAAKNERNFSEEVLNQSKMEISLQYGSNKGATQSGMTAPGTYRHL
ncbi:calponin-3-like isoform X1 [Branchiostoma floridae x Branchiostoma japonicum]